jgi:Ni/Co efflux regulator RcnB
MRRILSAALALSLLGGAGAMAQPGDHHDNRGGQEQGRDQGRQDQGRDNHGADVSREAHQRNDQRREAHQWARGERLPTTYYQNRSYYVDYRSHHLRRPPYGYRWVQVDNNYALVAITSGLIASIIAASN